MEEGFRRELDEDLEEDVEGEFGEYVGIRHFFFGFVNFEVEGGKLFLLSEG